MESPIAAVGFSDLENKYGIQKLISEILDKPTAQYVGNRPMSKEIIGEYLKEYGQDMYVMVRVVVRENGKEQKLEIEQCEPYLKSSYKIGVDALSVECIDTEYNYYAICEEADTGMEFIFWLQNAVDYIEAAKTDAYFNEIQIAALGMEGTIVLPIEKDAEEEEIEREEREKIKHVLQKARQGDEEARAQLEAEERELDEQLKERMYEEDFLSIMSGYFVPTTLVDATYAILGEILEIKTRQNKQTQEELFLFTLSVNDMPLEVLINKKDLVGYPTVGMRFMGTCWLQGTVVTDK